MLIFVRCYIQPSLGDEKSAEQDGIHKMIFDCIRSSAIDIQKDLWKHIVLSGGSTMYPGLPTRLEKELKELYLTNVLKGKKELMKKFKIKVEVSITHLLPTSQTVTDAKRNIFVSGPSSP